MARDFSEREWLAIPAIARLAEADHWVCWGNRASTDRGLKAPYQPTGLPASSTNPQTWSPFAACFAAVVDGHFMGVGRVLSEGDPVVGVDLDHVLDGRRRAKPEAAEIIEQLSSYTEISPSGTGLHIYSEADLGDFTGRKHGNLEIYATGRYLTVTAEPWSADFREITVGTAALLTLIEARFKDAAPPKPAGEGVFGIDPDAEPPWQKLVDLMGMNKKFHQTWKHERKDFGTENQSLSSYDLSIVNFTAQAQWTDQEIIDTLIWHRREHGSAEKGLRRDYLARTLTTARDLSESRIPEKDRPGIARTAAAVDEPKDEQLDEMSKRLGLQIQRVIQRGIDPAFYYVETEHGEVRLGDSRTILRQSDVRAAIMGRTRLFMQRVRPMIWDRLVTLLVQAAELEELGEGQRADQTRSWIQGYLGKRPAMEPETPEEKLDCFKRNRAVRIDGVVWICATELQMWIAKAVRERMPTPLLCSMLREIGCHPKTLSTWDSKRKKQHNSRRWSIPES